MAALAGSLLLTTACKRDQVSPDADIVSAEDQGEANVENALSSDILSAAAPVDKNVSGSPAVASDPELRRIYGTCATRTYNATTRILTIDFGPTNCLCPDGRYRRGKVIVQFTTDTPTRRAGAEVTRENYFVNDNQHTATRIFTDLGSGSFSVDVPSASIIRANNGGTHSWTANWVFTRTAGFGTTQTSDDVYSVTGQSSGTNRRGVSYTTTIQQPLIKRGDCYKYYVAGTVNIVNSRSQTLLLNYDPSGTQACDNSASVTVNGRTYPITLR
ncbi:hypothetical protein GCM10023185_03160 [Hymenobacter saemangeumensis]|uniref:Lipoprotein n=2 Tax=Hymenobacter saemangeumensis TaxID=1084522 RepID=A0ABP8HZ97_9BACT